MPEGDTIRRTADALRPRLVGRTVVRAQPAALAALAGRRVEGVAARGKHLLIAVEGGLLLHSHMRMTGSWQVAAPGERWRRPGRLARAVLELDSGDVAVCFAAPVVRLTSVLAWSSPTAHLGPDILDEPPDLDSIVRRAASSEATELGSLLLDQRVCAGIGNIWRCETLWELRLDPWTPLQGLDSATVRRCYATAHALMSASLRPAGGRRRRAAVHGRGGRPCPRCGGPVGTRAQGEHGRLTYWCPRCQLLRTVQAGT